MFDGQKQQNKWFCKTVWRQWAMWNIRPGCKQLSQFYNAARSHYQYVIQDINRAWAKLAEQSKVQRQQPIKLKAKIPTTFEIMNILLGG